MMKYNVLNIDSQVVGEIDLSDIVFGAPERVDILHRVVHWQLAKRRSGNHQTKTLSMVQGTTKKPFRQKGTGRARQGSHRAPQHRGGATVFGPVVRSYEYALPKKVRQLGLKVALSDKLRSGNLVVVDDLALKDAKTKIFDHIVKKNGWESALFIGGENLNEGLVRASSNVVGFDVLPQQGANVYSILQHKTLILSQDAVHHLEARLR